MQFIDHNTETSPTVKQAGKYTPTLYVCINFNQILDILGKIFT